MSNANGQARFKDGLILHFEYNGTSDTLECTWLYKSYEAMKADWRESGRFRDCACGSDEEVELYTDYGSGHTWPGRACANCLTITGSYQGEPWDFGPSLITQDQAFVEEANRLLQGLLVGVIPTKDFIMSWAQYNFGECFKALEEDPDAYTIRLVVTQVTPEMVEKLPGLMYYLPVGLTVEFRLENGG